MRCGFFVTFIGLIGVVFCSPISSALAAPLRLEPFHSAPLDFELASGSDFNSISTANAGFVRLSAMDKRVTLVNFWHSDCAPCVREMPLLAELAQSTSLRVIAVSLQKPADVLAAPDVVRRALRTPIVAVYAPPEPRGLLSRFGNPRGALPHTVLLNADRQVCASKSGEIDRAWITQVLARCEVSGNGNK